jgi:recombination protein RecT
VTLADTRAAVARRAEQAGQPEQQQNEQPDLAAFVNSMAGELQRAVPKHLTGERIARIALTSLRTTRHLDECTVDSFAGALMSCAQLGLEPGGAAGEAYLIPFFNRELGRYEVQLVIGYQGMVKLFWQSPVARHLDAQVVYENDHFEYAYGLDPVLVHRPALADRGRPVAYYAVASMTNGGSAFVVLSPSDVERIRQRAKAKNGGPWRTDYDAMAKKTCIRQLFKMLPKSAELARAVAHDETVRTDRSPEAIDAAPAWIPGEVVPAGAIEDGAE